jgi:hypothetical protein
MSEPPDSQNPSELTHRQKPVTRPLSPLPGSEEGMQGGKEAGVTHRPPATVLQKAGGGRLDRRPEPPPRPGDETAQVRLIPRTAQPPPWRVIFQTAEPPATIGLDVRQQMVIGRADPEGTRRPDLDLTPYLSAEHGVSRRHAELVPAPEGLYLSDLGSTNGTWVNGQYLEPGVRYRLMPGDRVDLGLLRLIVRTVALGRRAGKED